MRIKQILKITVVLMFLVPVGYGNIVGADDPPFVLKWTYATNQNIAGGLGPLAVDVDNNGIMEVFVNGDNTTAADKIFCFYGNNGTLKWSYTSLYSIAAHCPMEIYDLNNDGNYELIVPGPATLQVLHAENGTLYWKNASIQCSEAHQLVLDTDKNGYPYIYTCSASSTPGIAKLRKVDGRTGKALITKDIWYPCHGGLSAADVDNDGDFEIFMSDRSTGNGKGSQCYDANTLDLLWSRNSIYCSSHLPVIVDVNNDGILDVVVSQQRTSNAGIYCLDGRTGNNIAGKCQDSISGLVTHETFAIYDIDGDGNLELSTCAYTNVTVFDLGSWQIEATLAYDGKPPYYANVMGDEALEIVLSEEVSKIKIFNNQYQLIYTIPSSPTYGSTVQDIDGDGLNELIAISGNGIVRVYDTIAIATNPLPRTNTNHYSERNTRAAVYIPPPGTILGNNPPTIINPSPTNGSTGVLVSTSTLSISIRDQEGSAFDYTIQTSPSVGSTSVQGAQNGTKICTISGLAYSTTYRWYVNATDGDGWTRKWFTFTTKSMSVNNPPTISTPNPSNGSTNIPITTSTLTININDPEGGHVNWTITSLPNVGSNSGTNAHNGTKTCTVSGLAYSTMYTWYVRANDGSHWTNRSYWFTTVNSDIIPPQISNVARTTSDPLDNNPLYGWVNVSCTVTDNVAVFQVILRIQNPGGSWNNVSMVTRTTGKYYYNSTTAFSTAGNYSYYIKAKDTSYNSNFSSNVVFSMSPNWDINNDGRCTILDQVMISVHYGQTGTSGWIRDDIDNNGVINVLDLISASNHYNELWW